MRKKAIPASVVSWGQGILLVAVWIFPGILLSEVGYSLEYDSIQNVRVAASLDKDRLLPLDFGGFNFIPEHQGSEILELILEKVAGLSVEQFQILPIGSFLVPLAFYILGRECFGHKIAALLSVSTAFDPTIILGSYHTTIYTWSRPLLFIFIYMYIVILRKKSPKMILLATLIFIALFSIYWTDSALMVVFALMVNLLFLVVWIFQRKQGGSKFSSTTLNIALAFTIIYLGFGEFAYNILPSILGRQEQFGTAVFSLYQRVLQLVGVAKPTEEVFSTFGETNPGLVIQLIRYTLMIASVGLLLLKNIMDLKKTRRIPPIEDSLLIIMWSLVGVLLFHTFLYSSYGHASTRYIALLGPLIGMIALAKIGRIVKRAYLFPAILGGLACINFVVSFPKEATHSDWRQIKSSVEWLADRNTEWKITSNVGTYGWFSMIIASRSELPVYSCYSDATYDALIDSPGGDAGWNDIDGYIVLDRKGTAHEICPGFTYYPPLVGFLDQLSANPHLEWIFDNGSIWIIKPLGEG